MRKEGRVQNYIIAVLAIAIVGMSIGFAAYSQTLTIGGVNGTTPATATVKKATWSIHYITNTFQVTSGTGYVAATGTPTITNTDVTFTTTLNKPGDKFQFTIDITNDGTFDAYFDSITMSSLTAAQAKYLTYTITYDGGTYTATTTGITGKTLNPNVTKTMTVTLEYIQPADENDLPQTDDPVTLTASLDYKQTV